MVRFDVVFDIIVKILGSLLVIVGTLAFVLSAFVTIIMGAPVWQCVIMVLTALLCVIVCISTCLSAQGKL